MGYGNLRPVGIAHRGGSLGFPENTLAAFRAAADLGLSYIETDVHSTRDGIAVISHDSSLRRVWGVDADIEQLAWDDLRRLRSSEGTVIDRLDDVLAALPETFFSLDLKSYGSVRATATVLEGSPAVNRVCVSSFSDGRLRTFRSMCDESVTFGLGRASAVRMCGEALLGLPLRRHGSNASIAQLPWAWKGRRLLGPKLVESFHKRGLVVHVWNIETKREFELALSFGIDGLITDNIVDLIGVLRN